MTAQAQATELRHDATYVSKLTVKTLGDPSKVKSLQNPNEKHNLGRIFGLVSDVKYKEDVKKPGSYHTQFVGTFEGISMENGEIFRSGVLYLPAGISETMEQAFKQIKAAVEKDGGNASAEFAFEIRSVRASNPIGYSYEAQAIVKPEKSDPLEAMRKQLLALPTAGEVAKSGKALGTGATAPAKK